VWGAVRDDDDQRERPAETLSAKSSSARLRVRHATASGLREAMSSGRAPQCRHLACAAKCSLRGGRERSTTIFAVVLTLSAVTLVAAIVPTLRGARIDPAKTLREG
jgi:hypothetical protein